MVDEKIEQKMQEVGEKVQKRLSDETEDLDEKGLGDEDADPFGIRPEPGWVDYPAENYPVELRLRGGSRIEVIDKGMHRLLDEHRSTGLKHLHDDGE